ncbi:MAG: Ig-like domain-containing protein, partial [Candidatus Ornithomonoglobus sp.]
MRERRIISAAVSAAMLVSAFAGIQLTSAAAAGIENWTANTTGTPQYHTTQRQMEELNRGLIASYFTADSHAWFKNGVYLSWRLLGHEDLTNQAFDIYRDGTKIYTTGVHDATNYVDYDGTETSQYIVVKAGDSIEKEIPVTPTANYTAHGSSVTVGNSEVNSFTYVDIPISRPAPVARMGDGKTSYYYTYDTSHEGGANDASVGDLDGDGDYEIVLKWDPTDSKDSAGADFTGNVYIDAYEIDTNNGGYKWRIDLGKNVTAGQHYTQYIVYDFDGDGRSEVAMQTAPGSKDGLGNYVSEAGDTEEIRNVDNTKSYIGTSGSSKGKNLGPEYYTIFDGETGEAICTTAAIPLGSSSDWGDGDYNRAMRFLAGVAYLDGVHPSLIECRGYYAKTVIRAYSFDGGALSLQWEYSSGSSGLYGEGFHNLGIADIDNDGYDEIVYGSACLDQDGQTVLGDTNLGHGDAQHTSDFNNDGIQESFVVHEESKGYKSYAGQFKVTGTGTNIWGTSASADTGRGVMDNIDDEYAKTHPNALALGWESSNAYTYDLNGAAVGVKPDQTSKTMTNFLVYWDGDLSRELLDGIIIAKYHADPDGDGSCDDACTKRFYGPSDGYSLTGGTSNNYTKAVPSLCADIWGDWREEVILPVNKDSATEQAYLRIYTSTIPTEYRLTTLMHDAQYRCSVAWQNVGYNQPTHQSYYIGSAALAKDSSGNTLNYLAPATLFTSVGYGIDQIDVTGLALSESTLRVEQGKTETLTTVVTPADATRKAVIWTSSDTSVATVSNGIVTGVKPGTATITATSKYDSNIYAFCEVTVWSTPVTGITVDSSLTVGTGFSKKLTASVLPENASDQKVIWSSSNPAIAAVDSDGNVTGVTTGAAVITATTNEGGYTAACNVSVNPITETDVTGDGIWITDNTDSETLITKNTASDASFAQTSATVGGNFYRTFEKLTENHAVLTFTYKTGGQKLDGTNWNWDGHEYSFYVKLLGTDDQNIITLSQAYTSGAQPTMSKTGNSAADILSTAWTLVDNGGTENPLGRSSTTWYVTADFDYDNDVCNIILMGSDGNIGYTTSFELNGLSLEKLEFESTVDGSGAISWAPSVSDLSYTAKEPSRGISTIIYEKGTRAETAWTADDVNSESWTKTGTSTADLIYDGASAEFGRVYYNPTKPGAEYSSSLTFDTDDNALVTYDVNWYFGNATNSTSNYEYIQFGDNLRLGWNSDYKLYVSADGGTSWNDNDSDGTADSIFNEGNAIYTKHIKLIFDTASHKIQSLTFDGAEITAYTDYQLPTTDAMNGVTFGLQRGGSTANWEYPNGLDSILVTQFIEGAEPTPTPLPTEVALIGNSFDKETVGNIITMGETVQPAYTDLEGVTLYIGSRNGGDTSSGFSIESITVNTENTNALVMFSGRFANSNRGPRFTINTPVLEDDTIYTATIDAMPVDGATLAAQLFYGNSTTTQASNEIKLTPGTWGTITVTLSKVNGIVTRTIYLDGSVVT